jgi:general secretion pathway protein G
MSTPKDEERAPGGAPVAGRRKPAFWTRGRIGILLVVLVSIGLLVLVYPCQQNRPNTVVRTTWMDFEELGLALGNFKTDTGRYPTTQEGLHALVQPPAGLKGWNGPYVGHEIRTDEWGNPYVYVCPGKHNVGTYDLHSFGPSGKDGADDNINNWTAQ